MNCMSILFSRGLWQVFAIAAAVIIVVFLSMVYSIQIESLRLKAIFGVVYGLSFILGIPVLLIYLYRNK